MDGQSVLKELGLSEAEAKVYLSLLETGSTLVGPIIKKTGLHRATTYQLLQRLKEKGLVSSVIKGKKQHFEPVHPDRLMDILKEREEHLQKVLPALKARLESSRDHQEITVHTGIKGIRAVMNRMLEELNPEGTYYDFGASGLFFDVMGAYFLTWQRKKRKYKIWSKVIFSEDIKKRNPDILKEYHGEGKFHPKEYGSMTDTMIYNDTVVLFLWRASPPVAVLIKNEETAKGYLNQFEILWKHARKDI